MKKPIFSAIALILTLVGFATAAQAFDPLSTSAGITSRTDDGDNSDGGWPPIN